MEVARNVRYQACKYRQPESVGEEDDPDAVREVVREGIEKPGETRGRRKVWGGDFSSR